MSCTKSTSGSQWDRRSRQGQPFTQGALEPRSPAITFGINPILNASGEPRAGIGAVDVGLFFPEGHVCKKHSRHSAMQVSAFRSLQFEHRMVISLEFTASCFHRFNIRTTVFNNLR